MKLAFRLRKVWDELFRPAENELLGWFRALFCLAIACEVSLDREFFLEKQASGFCAQLEVFEFLHLPTVSAGVYEVLVLVLVVALLLSAFGVLGRLPLLLSLALFGYIVGTVVGCDRGVENTYTAWNHAIVWQNLLILTVAPGVNRWNLFSWFGRPIGSMHMPRWPVELLKFNLVFAYFAGGIAKVRGGLEWMNGYTLQYHLLDRHLSLDLPLALGFASSWWLCFFASVTMVALELTCLIVFLVPRLTVFYVGTFFALQIFWMFFMKLHWMKYFGWSYLIYALELGVFAAAIWSQQVSGVREGRGVGPQLSEAPKEN